MSMEKNKEKDKEKTSKKKNLEQMPNYDEKAENLYNILGENLKKARKNTPNKYSQEDIAGYLGTIHTRISNLENGKTNPCFADIKFLADFYNVSLDWLCTKHESETVKEHDKTPWRDIPPILALLQTLEYFGTNIEFRQSDEETFAKLSFYENAFTPNNEQLKEFFVQYQAIYHLIKSGEPYAEAIDILTSHLAQKYKNI